MGVGTSRPGIYNITDPLHNATILAHLYGVNYANGRGPPPLIRCPYEWPVVINDTVVIKGINNTLSDGGERITLDSSCNVTATPAQQGIVVTAAGDATTRLEFTASTHGALTPGSTIPSQLALLTVGLVRVLSDVYRRPSHTRTRLM
jgi:hypothetical protein